VKGFSRRGYRIAEASFEVKLIYTFFLLFVVVGLLTIGGYEFRHIGFQVSSIAEHYRGSGDDGLKFAKSFQSLLETTHFHSFIMGLIYLTLAHLFVATGISKGLKMSIVVGAFVFTLLDLILPWGVRYVSAGMAPVLMAAWVGEWATYVGMVLISFYDLWIRPRPDEDSFGSFL
jgi:hypothetical protein